MTSAVAELELDPRTRDVQVPERARADTLAASVIVLLLMTVAQRLIGFGRGVFFCRWLAPEQLGEWDVAFGFLNLAAPLAVVGLPGAFGRYVEYYRRRGQFHTFLRRTCTASAATGTVAVALVMTRPGWFSQLIFGSQAEKSTVFWLALCLAAVIMHNFLLSLFIAVRRYRIVTVLQFVQSLGFAVIGLGLLSAWQPSTSSVVIAFGLATMVAIICSMAWARELVADEPRDTSAIGHDAFWAKLMPFAVWMWVTNLLSNSFELVDRYMIVHHGGMTDVEALRQVGYYHSSRLVPLLFVGVASLLGSMITPHLSHDWEHGRQAAVVRRLNMTLKLLLGALLAGSLAALVVAPWMFNVAFQHKFAGGLAVLPWTLAYCAWFGTLAVAQNYLWCVERPGLGSLCILVGLVTNVAANAVLLPRFGLQGAVWATALANFVALALTFKLSRWQGMRIDRGTWLLALTPLSLGFGAPVAAIATAAVVAVVVSTDWLLTRDEKHELRLLATSYLEKIRDRGHRAEKRAPEPS